MVSAVHNSLRQVGQVFGVAVLGALVYARLRGRSRRPRCRAVLGTGACPNL
jgi:hypothetical protein